MVVFWSNLVHTLQLTMQIIPGYLHVGKDSKSMLTSTASCVSTSTTIVELVTCLEAFTVPPEHYNNETYEAAQPTSDQRSDWKKLIDSFLSVDGDCSSVPILSSLQGIYTIEAFQNMCILYETSFEEGIYTKGWGFMMVPRLRTFVSRAVHFSAPHPMYDRETVPQAAFLFESTGSKSLLVPGRIRTALLEPSKCIPPTSPSQDFYKTDPAHNILELFFDANLVISEWQNKNHGCPSSSCGYIQLHGKKLTTCPDDDIFLSAGLGNSTTSVAWYNDATDRPIKRLRHNLRLSFPSSNISLPSDSPCELTATKNVFGRYLNGVPAGCVCNKGATNGTATGKFLHAEQSSAIRSPLNYNAWTQAILNTFDVTCADGMVLDPATKLCRSRLAGSCSTHSTRS